MITELTKEQVDKQIEYTNKWIQKGLSSDFPSEQRVKEIIQMFYDEIGEPTPEVFIVDSPSEAIAKARELGAECFDFYWMHHNAGSCAFYDCFLNEVGVGPRKQIETLIAGAELGWTLFYDKACIVSKKPVVSMEVPLEEIKGSDLRSGQDQDVKVTHSLKGPAIYFKDGDPCNIYSVFGVRVDPYVVDNPEQITVEDIEKEQNLEVKRVKIDQYGQARYLQDSGATVVNHDDFGTLYRKDIEGDEPLMMVKVVNSTPEPDGTFRDYFIRVDPNAYGGLKTARQAVASTFRNDDGSLAFEDYNEYCDNLVAQS